MIKRAFKASFDTESKKLHGEGAFSGYASVFGNVDKVGDIVTQGAFKRTLNATAGRSPILWNHAHQEPPIGKSVLDEDSTGLHFDGQLFINKIKRADEVFVGIKNGVINKMSFMYEIIKSEMGTQDGEQVRFLKELRLFEISPVNFPANEEAEIITVKSQGQIFDQIRAIQEQLKEYRPDKEKLMKIQNDLAALHQRLDGLTDAGTTSKYELADGEIKAEAQTTVSDLLETVKDMRKTLKG